MGSSSRLSPSLPTSNGPAVPGSSPAELATGRPRWNRACVGSDVACHGTFRHVCASAVGPDPPPGKELSIFCVDTRPRLCAFAHISRILWAMGRSY